MALTSTMYRFEVDLSDVDRGVYDSVSMRVPMHPSETGPYLITRVLAFLLNYDERLTFSKGVCDTDESTIFLDDYDGTRKLAIEIGQPSAERLHKTAKAAEVVKVYTDRTAQRMQHHLAGKTVHRLDEIALYCFDAAFLNEIIDQLDRNNSWALTQTEGELYLTIGSTTITGRAEPSAWSPVT
ncbi:MAG: YaeQ family protein [Bradymonadia bacterium]